MALVSMRELLDHAAANGYGIPAFNVNNLEQVQAVMEAAEEVGAPVILQASAGARKYAGEPFIKHLIQAAAEMLTRTFRWSCTRTTAPASRRSAKGPSTWASARS
jgi:fructose/tagatose bisphosphate aldolase